MLVRLIRKLLSRSNKHFIPTVDVTKRVLWWFYSLYTPLTRLIYHETLILLLTISMGTQDISTGLFLKIYRILETFLILRGDYIFLFWYFYFYYQFVFNIRTYYNLLLIKLRNSKTFEFKTKKKRKGRTKLRTKMIKGYALLKDHDVK